MAYNTAMPSGYDYEFVQEPPDDYNCSICHLVMRKPVQTKCGHQFCKECLEEANKRNPQCPVDRKPLTAQDIFEDKAMGQKIMSLVIKCQEKACIWQGDIRDIENHENKCDYKIVDCDNESCSVRKPRCEMVGHIQDDCLYRIVSCPHCKNAYTFRLLEEHTSECPQCPVSCQNNCGKKITREQVTSHTSTECPLTIVPCSYQNIGCDFTVQRQLLNDHIDNHVKQHLTIAVEKILSIQNQTTTATESMRKEMDEMKKKMPHSNASVSISKHTNDIVSIKNQVDDLKKQIPPSNAIKSIQKQIIMIIIIMMIIIIIIIIIIIPSSNAIESIRKQMDDMKKQIPSSNAIESIRKQMDEMKKQIPSSNAISESIQKHKIDIECIQKQLDGNPSTMTTKDEKRYSFIWNVNDFSQQLETAKQPGRDIKLDSKPFRTHKYGYKLKLRLIPNGQGKGKGTHVSVFLVIMRGEYDALLTWPFDWLNLKFILIDQKPNPSQRINIENSFINAKSLINFGRPTTDANLGYGFIIFVSHETLATENYVANDTLFLKLEIEKTEQVDEIPQLMTKDDDNHYSYIWKVKNFSQQLETAKQSGRDIRLHSKPLYTHKHGYKLKLGLDPNGLGRAKRTHVSVYLVIMRGEYDAFLTWPFDWKVKFILIDQKPNPSLRRNIQHCFDADIIKNVCERPTTEENFAKGPSNFVSHKVLATENYVVDGTLFLKLELEKL